MGLGNGLLQTSVTHFPCNLEFMGFITESTPKRMCDKPTETHLQGKKNKRDYFFASIFILINFIQDLMLD